MTEKRIAVPGLHLSRTVALADGHEVTVTLRRRDTWSIELIDLETMNVEDIESPEGGPYQSEEQALDAARQLARKVLDQLPTSGPAADPQ